MNIVPLASSSKGNAYLVERAGMTLLIDCGLSYRELGRRMREHGASVDSIAAVLITHSHTDHISGLEMLLKKHDLPVYANMMTAEAIAAGGKVPEEAFVCFENGQTFDLGAFTVHPFSIPHDTSDPVGFLVSAPRPGGEGAETYFHGTDIGTPLDSIGLKLAEADVATLESNHDPVMLRTSGRAPSLIQRIAGPRGHLSNDQAAGLVKKFASPRLKKLFLAHLSQDCNTPNLAERAMREALAEIGREDIELEVLEP